MKKLFVSIICLGILFTTSACGKRNELPEQQTPVPTVSTEPSTPIETVEPTSAPVQISNEEKELLNNKYTKIYYTEMIDEAEKNFNNENMKLLVEYKDGSFKIYDESFFSDEKAQENFKVINLFQKVTK